MNIDQKIEEISGVGPAYIKRMHKIGIKTVHDLLFYFPQRYDDFSKVLSISKINPGEVVSVKGSVWQITNKRTRRGMTITEAVISDETGAIKAVWFNQPFIKTSIKSGEEIIIAGKPEWEYGTIIMRSPSYEKLTNGSTIGKELKHTGRIVPVYPETEGLSSKWLRHKIEPLLKLVDNIEEYLPKEVIKKYDLSEIKKTIKELHFPRDYQSLGKAKRRMDFEEMFLLQLAVCSVKKEFSKERSPLIKFEKKKAQEFKDRLPFEMTNAQRKSAFEILKDMEKKHPMNRLLEGDVGSGKTIVASMALFMVASSGFQSVIIAPTEILAGQHFASITELIGNFNIGLITGNSASLVGSKKFTKNSKQGRLREFWDFARNGEIDIIIGTHALLQEKNEFKNLGLVIIDEQHRFGVEQRAVLRKENKEGLMPHFLSMSATPIPRTLTLTFYGDLDVSILDELPKGRKPILTRLVENNKREQAYKFIDQKIDEGRQVFVICPMIEESDKLEAKSVMQEFKKLEKVIFPDRKIATLHGKMKITEKEKVMSDFKQGKIDLLVATSVVEVGVNIPNASIMMIEGSDRFGLAQLHQFRGRVGRGDHQAYCFIFTESSNELTLKRLHSFVNTTDGFKLAEADLEIRGPGEVFGKAQHGVPDIKTKNLMNITLIKETRKAAEEFLEENDLAEFLLLKDKIKKYDIVKRLE